MELIKKFVANAKANNVNIDSIVVEENDKVEECVLRDIELHELRSCGKMLIAMAYGIAIKEKLQCKNGEILSLDTKVYKTLKQVASNIPNQAKQWTIRTLLTHQTGYDKMYLNESHVENLDKFKLLNVIFDIPLKYAPNTHYTYSNVEPYLLSVFFKENFGVQIDDYINKKILKPLGVKNYRWEKFGNYCAAATASYFNYKDFHKMGEMVRGAKKYFLQPFVDRETVPDHSLAAPSREDLEKYREILSNYVDYASIRGMD